jgi:hypothetical protein
MLVVEISLPGVRESRTYVVTEEDHDLLPDPT